MTPKPTFKETVTTLPTNKRYIATYNIRGQSVYAPSPPQLYLSAGEAGMAHSYSIPSVPVKMENDIDYKTYLSEGQTNSQKSAHIVVPETKETPNGANCLVVDLPPGAVIGMHRTLSIDFSICVIGTIVHELDSRETVTLKPGVSNYLARYLNLSSMISDVTSRITLCREAQCIDGTTHRRRSQLVSWR